MQDTAAADPAAPLSMDEFARVDLRVGVVVSAAPNPKAKKPAHVLQIDFGPLGLRTSSAQITALYEPADLIGCQVIAVVNFPPRRIAGVVSEVLVLAAVDPERGTVLLQPERSVGAGTRIL